MAVLSVDLAYRRWSDLGIVVLDRTQGAAARRSTTARARGRSPARSFLPAAAGQDDGPIDANVLAGRLNHLCAVRGIRVMMLDGPQAWKSKTNGFAHARVSERQLNTAAKTGLPGMVKPVTYRPFAEFCLDVYDALCRRGWRRWTRAAASPPTVPQGSRSGGELSLRGVEVAGPYAAALEAPRQGERSGRGLRRAARADSLHHRSAAQSRPACRPSSAGCRASRSTSATPPAVRIVGNPPRREDGHWREGFIVLPLPPHQPLGCAGSTDEQLDR